MSFGDHARADAPSAPGNLVLSCGLLTVPVKVFTGLDPANSLPRKTFTTTGAPVGSQSYDKETGRTLDPGEPVVKMIEHDGQMVVLADEEIEAAVGPFVKGTAEITSFVPFAALGNEYVIESVQQMRPAPIKSGRKTMPSPAADKAFMLLMRAMEKNGVVGLLQVPGRTSTRPAALTWDGRLLLLAYADRVRKALPMPETEPSEKELELADRLVNALIADELPVLEDEDAAKVRAYLDMKIAAGGEVVEIARQEPEEQATVDLESALAASLEALDEKKAKSA